jgi:hypothetical protein
MSLAQVTYTYYQNVSSPSVNVGTTNGALRTTKRRAPLWLMMAAGDERPAAIMSQADSYTGSGTAAISSFAAKSFTYYQASPPSTNSVNTPFAASENLSSEYGGTNAIAGNMVATETVNGCPSCATEGSLTKSYFYMSLSNLATDQNQVVSLVVEDTQDSAGAAVCRTIYGFENSGRMLRKALIQNPTASSPKCWCESTIFATATGSTALPYRVAESRMPSAHTGVTSNSTLQQFLNPYNGSIWTNDTSTVNASSGCVYTYLYNSAGMQTDALVKNGESGTAYYIGASDYGDSANPTLKTADWDYPSQTTTRTGGNQTSYSYTFYDPGVDQQVKTCTTTLPVVPTTQNGSGVATTVKRYFDSYGRLRWTQDGEGYIS